MNNKLKLFQSINFKVAMVFILLLLATIEIIGAYFTRQLEQNSIDSFETSVQVPSIITSQISAQIEQKDKKSANQSISSILNDYDNSQISDIEVVDNDGVIRAVSNINYTDRVGQKKRLVQTSNPLAILAEKRQSLSVIMVLHTW